MLCGACGRGNTPIALEMSDKTPEKGVWKSGKGKGRQQKKGRQLQDTVWHKSRVPCMGRCDTAPVLELSHAQIDHATLENVTAAIAAGKHMRISRSVRPTQTMLQKGAVKRSKPFAKRATGKRCRRIIGIPDFWKS